MSKKQDNDINFPEMEKKETPDASSDFPAYSDFTGFLHEKSWIERNGFPFWLPAFLWVILSFIFFQVFGSVLLLGYLLLATDSGIEVFEPSLLVEHLDIMLAANSVSQILFLGVATWLITGLSTSGKRSVFLRFQWDERTLPLLFYAALLIFTVQPLVWFFSWINLQIPFSESYMAFEETQLEILKSFLTGDYLILMTIFHIGIVPSVCEEILYRGYIQRSFEKSWGIWAAIILSGLLFGLYHIRLTQLIPLALIGMLLAWIVWRSNSIYPAIVAHFVNNGGSVAAAYFYPDFMIDQMTITELPPFWLLLVSLVATLVLLRYIHLITKEGKNYV